MNKTLTEKVKAKCKDMGLSEEYLNGLTELLGGAIADDSTDESAIDVCVNQIEQIAKKSQGEATRWAQKAKSTPTPAPTPAPTPTPSPVPPSGDMAEMFKQFKEQYEERLKSIETENTQLKAERTAQERSTKIGAAFTKYNIPEYIRPYLSVPADVEDAKIDEHVATMAQTFVTHQLPQSGGGQNKVASEQETAAAAEAFFKTHVKSES